MTRSRAPETIDWSQLWYPGPRRVFTAAEMAEAGQDGPSRTMLVVTLANVAILVGVLLVMAPPDVVGGLMLSVLAFLLASSAAANWVWWRPSRLGLLQASLGATFAPLVVTWLVRSWVPERSDRVWHGVVLAGGVGVVVVMLWFVAVWRAQQIESRLRERAEREQAIEMARRLAAAQLEPHFLFNTLASLQHWVDTGDARASRLLSALTGYLRTTLPMFDRPLLPLADELAAVRHYLEVMRLRLGDRLQVEIDVPTSLGAQRLPPGLLLTLVENALLHGIEPQLAGGRLWVRALRDTAPGGPERVVLEVQDNGPGPAPDPSPRQGTGLTNARQRLQLAYGHPAATLELAAADGGGAIARIRWPFEPQASTRP
ncbi:MAG: sensor histidine kinase [Rubrivivax sp.]|jgi:signal transduction histidine kinase|nr:histidine kinase [Rubrivivax sp.]